MEIYTPEEFILSTTFGEYSINSEMLISEILMKIHDLKIDYKIKVRKNKEFAITLPYDTSKNIATIWARDTFIQVEVLKETQGKEICFSKEDISEELLHKIYKKYIDRCEGQISFSY